MFSFLEPEEFIGRQWHRLVGNTQSWPRYPEAAIELKQLQSCLGIFFHGLGGDPALSVNGVAARTSGHRLRLRQRLGQDDELMVRTSRDGNALYLPPRIDCFPDPELNRSLYFWLAAFMAYCPIGLNATGIPLHDDLRFLRNAFHTTSQVLKHCPGLIVPYQHLTKGLLALRPQRTLPQQDFAVEQAVLKLLGNTSDGGPFWSWITATSELPLPAAPANYRPFLPVPLWGEALNPVSADNSPRAES